MPFLGCTDLAVFKAFFDRTKDWADLEEMAVAGTLDTDRVVGILTHYLGAPEARVDRLRALDERSHREAGPVLARRLADELPERGLEG